nr:hypothetical protein [Tanacetum cinerariifolium]
MWYVMQTRCRRLRRLPRKNEHGTITKILSQTASDPMTEKTSNLSNVLEIKEPCLDTITHVKAVQQHSDPFAAGNITKCVLDLGLEQIHGPSSSSQTQEMTSLRNQNNSSIHPQANAPTVDMAAGTNAVGPQHLNNEPDVTTSCCSRTGMRGCTQLTPSHGKRGPPHMESRSQLSQQFSKRNVRRRDATYVSVSNSSRNHPGH